MNHVGTFLLTLQQRKIASQPKQSSYFPALPEDVTRYFAYLLQSKVQSLYHTLYRGVQVSAWGSYGLLFLMALTLKCSRVVCKGS